MPPKRKESPCLEDVDAPSGSAGKKRKIEAKQGPDKGKGEEKRQVRPLTRGECCACRQWYCKEEEP